MLRNFSSFLRRLDYQLFLQHSEELTAVKKLANNGTNDNETLTEYDQINDPRLSPKDPQMTIPVNWDLPFQTDNQRNHLYEQRVHTFVSASPPISLSELYETVNSALADHSQSSTTECIA